MINIVAKPRSFLCPIVIFLSVLFFFNYTVAAEDGVNFLSAAETGKLEEVKRYIHQGGMVDVTDADGWTALMKASYQGHYDIVEYLLENEANVNAKNKHGRTALISASAWHPSIVKLLVRKGANVNVADNRGRTALMQATYFYKLEIINFLINSGADLNIKDNDDRTALDWAKKEEYDDVVKILLKHGAK
jgi:ankyrin repeat protein